MKATDLVRRIDDLEQRQEVVPLAGLQALTLLDSDELVAGLELGPGADGAAGDRLLLREDLRCRQEERHAPGKPLRKVNARRRRQALAEDFGDLAVA